METIVEAAYLMTSHYYVSGRTEYGRDVMVPFEVSRRHMISLEHRNQRLKLRRLSLRANLLEQCSKGLGLEFRHIMQADFILFLRDHLDRPDDQWHWWPETLLYVGRYSGAFEIFARCKSKAYFDKVKIVFGVESKEEIEHLLEMFESDKQRLPRWKFESFSPRHLLAFDDIATRP